MTEREPTMDEYELGRVHARIRDILSVAPATGWSLEESKTVQRALVEIMYQRQAGDSAVSGRNLSHF